MKSCMTKPARLILFVCSTLLFQAASAHGAEDLPRGDQSNLLRVGDLSGKEALVFEGNTTFSKEKILQGLIWLRLSGCGTIPRRSTTLRPIGCNPWLARPYNL